MICSSANWRTISMIAFCSSLSSSYEVCCSVEAATAIGSSEVGFGVALPAASKDTRATPFGGDNAPVPGTNAERLESALGLFDGRDAVEMFADPSAVEELRQRLEAISSPDLAGAMVASEGGLSNAWSGIDGFIEAWREFLMAFSAFENKIEDLLENGDMLVALTRQSAVTATGGVTVENESAGVFTFAEGLMLRAEFHLERDSGLRSAGLDPADYSAQE
jgi:hypothetical protein